MYHFTSQKEGMKPFLSWVPSYQHTYTIPENYTIWIEAFNGAGSVFRSLSLPVYGKLYAPNILVIFENSTS